MFCFRGRARLVVVANCGESAITIQNGLCNMASATWRLGAEPAPGGAFFTTHTANTAAIGVIRTSRIVRVVSGRISRIAPRRVEPMGRC